MHGILAQFQKCLAGAERTRRPIKLRIDSAQQPEDRPANGIRHKIAHRLLAGMKRISAIPGKEFVARITR